MDEAKAESKPKRVAVQVFLSPEVHEAVTKAAVKDERSLRKFVMVAATEKAAALGFSVE